MANNCSLEKPNCKRDCARCGWNPEEAERRKIELRKNGLTLCNDGLHRMIVKRKESEADNG